MSEKNKIYKCEGCGLTAETVTAGKGSLLCCGTPMVEIKPQTADSAVEKHVPVVERIDNGTSVKVGSTLHPMNEEHYICWIEIINGDYVNRKYLNPGDAPEASFFVELKEGMIVREFCNKHGLWEYKV